MYKSLKSFVGKINMAKGQEKEITDKNIINDLLQAGYIEEVKIENEIKKEVEKVEEVEEVIDKRKSKKKKSK